MGVLISSGRATSWNVDLRNFSLDAMPFSSYSSDKNIATNEKHNSSRNMNKTHYSHIRVYIMILIIKFQQFKHKTWERIRHFINKISSYFYKLRISVAFRAFISAKSVFTHFSRAELHEKQTFTRRRHFCVISRQQDFDFCYSSWNKVIRCKPVKCVSLQNY